MSRPSPRSAETYGSGTFSTGLARGGDTRAEALTQLAEVIALEAGDGEPIDNPDEFLQDIGVDPDTEDEDLPDFLR